MFYLAQFCRICIKTGVQLTDIDTPDIDAVKLSEKLEVCTKMVINRESLSTQICQQCVKKLRISYDFQKLCQQSTKILQEYLTELISVTEKINPDNFVNSELRVTITPLSINVARRKRITKEQRCSLLKRLLMSKSGVNKRKHTKPKKLKPPAPKGGLRSIIDFTRNYDFSYKIERNNHTATPLSKLVNFTNDFFINNFTEFRNTILYIIENKDNFCEEAESDEDTDEDGDMFEKCPEEETGLSDLPCEELVVEPDIKIKTEVDYEDCESYSCNYYVEASYDPPDDEYKNKTDAVQYMKQERPLDEHQTDSVQMLDKLVGTLGSQRKTFSHLSVRCRTRGNPYINPELRQQFQMRSFRCNKCNRYFKSPGYLKAHISKIHPC